MKYKAIVKIEHWREHREIIDADNLSDAFKTLEANVKILYAKPISSVESFARLYCPCPECGTEQIDLVGCPNINCPSKQ